MFLEQRSRPSPCPCRTPSPGTPRFRPPQERAQEERVANASLPTSELVGAEPAPPDARSTRGSAYGELSAKRMRRLSPGRLVSVSNVQKWPRSRRLESLTGGV